MDIVSILGKKRQKIQDFQVRVRGKRAADFPKVWEEVEIIYILWGEDLDPKAVEHAIQLSEEKYCSASITLRAVGSVTSSYKLLSPGEKYESAVESIIGG